MTDTSKIIRLINTFYNLLQAVQLKLMATQTMQRWWAETTLLESASSKCSCPVMFSISEPCQQNWHCSDSSCLKTSIYQSFTSKTLQELKKSQTLPRIKYMSMSPHTTELSIENLMSKRVIHSLFQSVTVPTHCCAQHLKCTDVPMDRCIHTLTLTLPKPNHLSYLIN